MWDIKINNNIKNENNKTSKTLDVLKDIKKNNVITVWNIKKELDFITGKFYKKVIVWYDDGYNDYSNLIDYKDEDKLIKAISKKFKANVIKKEEIEWSRWNNRHQWWPFPLGFSINTNNIKILTEQNKTSKEYIIKGFELNLWWQFYEHWALDTPYVNKYHFKIDKNEIWWWKLKWLIENETWNILFEDNIYCKSIEESKTIIKEKYKHLGKAYTQLSTSL